MPNNTDKNDSKPHITPSESKERESNTQNKSGDPGRTPGKAEGGEEENAE